MAKQVLSDSLIASHQKGILWDLSTPGLGVRAYTSKKSYIYREKGASNTITIGEVNKLSLFEARKLVTNKSGSIMIYTFSDLCDEWLSSYASFKRKGVKEDQRRINKRLKPALGNLLLTQIKKREAFLYFNRWSLAGTIEANRCLSLASAIFNKAIEWELVNVKNPFLGIEKNPEKTRTRIANFDELTNLIDVLRASNEIGTLFMICLYCGLRKSEASGLKWKDIDLINNKGIVRATKNGKDFIFYFGDEIKKRLKKQKNKTPYVFPSRNGSHRVEVRKDWQRICNLAKIKGLTIHDLRRTFASKLYQEGIPIAQISHALNHSSELITRRYLHLGEQTKKETFDKASDIFSLIKSQNVA